jgi:TRAP-type C4-dicarboxylate transport system permease small subunit
MKAVLAGIHGIARGGLWLGGGLILLAAILIGIDVSLRRLFAVSIGGADELAGYALAIGTAWALAAALLDRAHIRIDSLYAFFPAPVRTLLDFIGLGLFVGFFALVGWHGIGVVQQSWVSGSRSQSALETPTVIPQIMWLVGLGVFVCIGTLLALVALARLLAGDRAGVTEMIGTRSSQEEARIEVRSAEARRTLDEP